MQMGRGKEYADILSLFLTHRKISPLLKIKGEKKKLLFLSLITSRQNCTYTRHFSKWLWIQVMPGDTEL